MKQVSYPSYLYKGSQTELVKNAEEHKALGEGWSDSPTIENPAHCDYNPNAAVKAEAEEKSESKSEKSSKSKEK